MKYRIYSFIILIFNANQSHHHVKFNVTLVGIMNIIKINQYQTHLKNYNGYRMWFNGLNYTKTFSFHMEKYDEI